MLIPIPTGDEIPGVKRLAAIAGVPWKSFLNYPIDFQIALCGEDWRKANAGN